MRNELYSEQIARVYDLIVHGRPDAEAEPEELAFLRWAFENAAGRPVRDVLDVGCGTGLHLVPLAREGFRVTGLDRSAAMLAECRRKLDARGLSAELIEGDMTELDADAAYDAALCMNSVICYLLDAGLIVEMLRRLRRALRPGGLLVLDNCNFFSQWYRLGEDYGDVREAGGVRVDYRDRQWLEDFASIYHVDIEATVTEGDETYEFRSEESLRAMTVGELTCYLERAGFEGIAAYPAYDLAVKDERSGDRLILLARRP